MNGAGDQGSGETRSGRAVQGGRDTRGPSFRLAGIQDVAALMESRAADPEWGPADPRTAGYMQGTHHPRQALSERAVFIALDGEELIGYAGGHLTRRYDCGGELQYLWVSPGRRRQGVAGGLLGMLAGWFREQGAARVCVDVLPDNSTARSFYTRHGAVELNPHWMVWTDFPSSLLEPGV